MMELLFSCFSILTFLLFVLTMVLKTTKRSRASDRSLNLPPGPRKLPIIGNLHQLVGSLPHLGLTKLAEKYGPVMLLQIGEIPAIVISSPEFAKQVTKTHDVNFASRIQTYASKIITYDSGMVFTPYNDEWRQLRKICTLELLTMKRVESFRSIREEEVSNLINWIASKEGSLINLTDKLFLLTFGITSKAAFGSKYKDQVIFMSVVKELVQSIGDISDLFPSIKLLQSISRIKSRVKKMHQKADKLVSNIIDEHNKKREARINTSSGSAEYEDLVDVLLKAQEDGSPEFRLNTASIKAVIFEIFLAGGETCATALDWALSEMMKNPRVLKKAQTEIREVYNRKGKIDETGVNEMHYLKLVIRETLRLHPSIPVLFPRVCEAGCKINEFDIPEKATIIINAWAMGRDSEYWAEPERFIPERFLDCSIDYKGNNFEYVPFGVGRRICPGITFANANLELPLAMLLYHFDWNLPKGMKPEDLDMTEAYGAAVRRKDDLCIIPTLYRLSSHVGCNP